MPGRDMPAMADIPADGEFVPGEYGPLQKQPVLNPGIREDVLRRRGEPVLDLMGNPVLDEDGYIKRGPQKVVDVPPAPDEPLAGEMIGDQVGSGQQPPSNPGVPAGEEEAVPLAADPAAQAAYDGDTNLTPRQRESLRQAKIREARRASRAEDDRVRAEMEDRERRGLSPIYVNEEEKAIGELTRKIEDRNEALRSARLRGTPLPALGGMARPAAQAAYDDGSVPPGVQAGADFVRQRREGSVPQTAEEAPEGRGGRRGELYRERLEDARAAAAGGSEAYREAAGMNDPHPASIADRIEQGRRRRNNQAFGQSNPGLYRKFGPGGVLVPPQAPPGGSVRRNPDWTLLNQSGEKEWIVEGPPRHGLWDPDEAKARIEENRPTHAVIDSKGVEMLPDDPDYAKGYKIKVTEDNVTGQDGDRRIFYGDRPSELNAAVATRSNRRAHRARHGGMSSRQTKSFRQYRDRVQRAARQGRMTPSQADTLIEQRREDLGEDINARNTRIPYAGGPRVPFQEPSTSGNRSTGGVILPSGDVDPATGIAVDKDVQTLPDDGNYTGTMKGFGLEPDSDMGDIALSMDRKDTQDWFDNPNIKDSDKAEAGREYIRSFRQAQRRDPKSVNWAFKGTTPDQLNAAMFINLKDEDEVLKWIRGVMASQKKWRLEHPNSDSRVGDYNIYGF